MDPAGQKMMESSCSLGESKLTVYSFSIPGGGGVGVVEAGGMVIDFRTVEL